MKLKKISLKDIPFKETNIIFGLVFLYIIILPWFFSVKSVTTAIFVGIYCFNTNKKGFSKSRALRRYFLHFVSLTVLLFICYFSSHSIIFLLISSFIVTFILTFFGMEEYIPGLKDYFPTLYVFSIYQGNLLDLKDVYSKILVIFVTVVISAVYGLLVNREKPIDRIRIRINEYIECIIEEMECYVSANRTDHDIYIEKTREAYNECLKEYYKSSEGIYLVSLQSKEIMRLMLKLHLLVENTRIHPDSDKKKLTEVIYSLGILLRPENEFNRADFVWNNNESVKYMEDLYYLKKKVFSKDDIIIKTGFVPLYRKEELIYWIKANFNKNSILFRYAVRLSILMTLSFITAKASKLTMGYWLPMTSVLLSQPYFEETYKRVFARILGTFTGLILASYFLKDVNSQTEIYVLVLILNYIIFLIVSYNYFIAVIVITITAMLSTKGVQTQEVLFLNRAVCTFLAGVYSFLVSYIFKSTSQKEIKYNFTNLMKTRIEILNLLLKPHRDSKTNRKFDRLMINANMYREKIIFQMNKKKDKNNIEFLGMDTIITERLIALYVVSNMKDLTKEEKGMLIVLRKVWLYTYAFLKSGNISDTKEFMGLILEVRRITDGSGDENEDEVYGEIKKLLSISYNYMIKLIKYSNHNQKQKRKLNFFKKLLKAR